MPFDRLWAMILWRKPVSWSALSTAVKRGIIGVYHSTLFIDNKDYASLCWFLKSTFFSNVTFLHIKRYVKKTKKQRYNGIVVSILNIVFWKAKPIAERLVFDYILVGRFSRCRNSVRQSVSGCVLHWKPGCGSKGDFRWDRLYLKGIICLFYPIGYWYERGGACYSAWYSSDAVIREGRVQEGRGMGLVVCRLTGEGNVQVCRRGCGCSEVCIAEVCKQADLFGLVCRF